MWAGQGSAASALEVLTQAELANMKIIEESIQKRTIILTMH